MVPDVRAVAWVQIPLPAPTQNQPPIILYIHRHCPNHASNAPKNTHKVVSRRQARKPTFSFQYRAVYRLRDGNLSERREIVGHQGGGLRPLRYPRNR
jgi:hypothetical protein